MYDLHVLRSIDHRTGVETAIARFPRAPDFESRLAGLPPEAPADGARRALKDTTRHTRFPEGTPSVAIVFREQLAICPYPVDGGQPSPLHEPLDDRYPGIAARQDLEGYFAGAVS